MYDDYLRGCAQILEALYLARRHKHFIERLDYFREEFASIEKLNTNAYIIANRILYTNMLHRCFVAGKFTEGLAYVKEIEDFMARYERHIDVHYKMLVNYKIASLYFGGGNYQKCMEYLSRITGTKDPQVRRDLQCFARILHLIASYEAGIDYNLEYQIRSVYTFLVKMNDMHEVQREMLGFLKKLGSIYADDLKTQFRELHERLELLEDHPYERRAFYYLDIQSWLESKITGKSMGEILQEKFKALSR